MAQFNRIKTKVKNLSTTAKVLKRCGILRINPRSAKAYLRYRVATAGTLERGVAYHPDRLFLIDDYGQMTYRDVRNAARNLAINLQRRGLKTGSTIGILARNSRGYVIPIIAAAYMGARPMVMNPFSSPAQIKNILSEYGADFFFFDAEFEKVADGLENIPSVIFGLEDGAETSYDTLENMISTKGAVDELPFIPEPQPTIIMSSGTSGIPKAVVQPRKNSLKVGIEVFTVIPWEQGIVVQLTASLFHTWGWANLLYGLLSGATLILRRKFDPEQAVEDCINYRPDAIATSGIFLQDYIEVAKKSSQELGPFKFVVSAGNLMPPKLVKAFTDKFGPVLINFYGSTEIGTMAIAGGEEFARHPDTSGRVVPGMKLKILRTDGTEADPGETGLIYAVNKMSSSGMLSDNEKHKMVDGLIYSGDLGHIDHDGLLYVHGRDDSMVIRGGENVFPRASSEFIANLPGVFEVYVKGIQEGLTARLIAYVSVDSSPEGKKLFGNSDAIKDAVRNGLAETNVPDDVIWMDELPHNEVGKVVPRLLPDPES